MRLEPLLCGSPMLVEVSMAKITDFSRAGTGTFSSRDGCSRSSTMSASAVSRETNNKVRRPSPSRRAERS